MKTTHKNSQIVKGEALSAPQRRKGSQEKKSTLEVVPPLFPSLQRHFPLDSDGQALPQVGVRLGFHGDLFEAATQISQEQEGLRPKRACRLDGHRCEDMALVEGCVLLLLALP